MPPSPSEGEEMKEAAPKQLDTDRIVLRHTVKSSFSLSKVWTVKPACVRLSEIGVMISDMGPPVNPLLTNTKLFRPPPALETASAKDRRGLGDPTPNSEGGTKKFFAYEMKKKKIIGAKNARTSVLNQFRQNTIRSVFSTRAYHCRKNAMVYVAGWRPCEYGRSPSVQDAMWRYFKK